MGLQRRAEVFQKVGKRQPFERGRGLSRQGRLYVGERRAVQDANSQCFRESRGGDRHARRRCQRQEPDRRQLRSGNFFFFLHVLLLSTLDIHYLSTR